MLKKITIRFILKLNNNNNKKSQKTLLIENLKIRLKKEGEKYTAPRQLNIWCRISSDILPPIFDRINIHCTTN